jgi:hypothetical protein
MADLRCFLEKKDLCPLGVNIGGVRDDKLPVLYLNFEEYKGHCIRKIPTAWSILFYFICFATSGTNKQNLLQKESKNIPRPSKE